MTNTDIPARTPFDPGDPFDAMADDFRKKIADMAFRVQEAAIYRELEPHRQMECFLAGTLSGVIGVALASIKPEGRDAMMEYVTQCLPVARTIAESILDGDEVRHERD